MTSKRENGLPDYRWLILAAAFLLLIYFLLPILSPFLIAAILAYICSPLVDRIDAFHAGRFSLGRTGSTLVMMLFLVGIFILLLLIVVPLLQKEILLVVQRLPAYITTLREKLDPWLMQRFNIGLDIDTAYIQQILTENWKTAGSFAGTVLKTLSTNSLAIIGWLVNMLLVSIVLFYLLRDWHALVERITQLLPRAWHGKVITIANEIDSVLAQFLRGQLSVMLLMSTFYATCLWLAGLELALPIGLIAGLLGFVPYVGFATGFILALLAAALQFTAFDQFIPVLAVFGLGQVLEGMVLTPWLVGDRIGLHPVAVIFALLAGGQLFGFSGILLALPVSAAIAVGLRHLKQSYLASDTYLK